MAIKVVGVGSVGTFCAVMLFMAAENDPLFLQVKQANASVLEPYAGKSVYSHHGQRVVMGQRLMQSASDMMLGWTEGKLRGRHFYLRQLHDMKLSAISQCEAELVRWGVMEGTFGHKLGLLSCLQTPGVGATVFGLTNCLVSERKCKGFKMEIPKLLDAWRI